LTKNRDKPKLRFDLLSGFLQKIVPLETDQIFFVMNIDALKVELIDWIVQLRDLEKINQVLTMKKKLKEHEDEPKYRKFGSGKNLIEYIADDFDAPLDIAVSSSRSLRQNDHRSE